MDLDQITGRVKAAGQGLLARAQLRPGQILVLGCSTSEIEGQSIGKGGSEEIALAVLKPLLELMQQNGLYLAVQACEHLNRALVVEAELLERFCLEQVHAYPVPHAGGSTAAAAMNCFRDPVLVEKIAAHAGLDIGQTLIGMHLRPVVVPVRLKITKIGDAQLTAARTRPKLIGGSRAVYVKPGTVSVESEK